MKTSPFFHFQGQGDLVQSDETAFMRWCEEEDWQALLSHTEHRRFEADELVIQGGELDDDLCLVQSGELEVLLPAPRDHRLQRIAVVEAGAVIGEQAFLDGQPRSATIRALSAGEIYRLSRRSFAVLAEERPELARDILLDLGRILSLRLRQANQRLAHLRTRRIGEGNADSGAGKP